MSTGPLRTVTPTLDIYIKLAQYPVLADSIRSRMRQEIFSRGIVSEEKFEAEVEEMALESQKREGTYDPFNREPATVWERRKSRIRDFHTDFYFGNSLPTILFEEIVAAIVAHKHPRPSSLELTFNPELAPWEMLFQQGELYEAMPPDEREHYSHHLKEIKVVLIKGMISDQLRFIGVAKELFSIDDLRRIYRRRIGRGKIGGKAAGMLLAWKILKQQAPELGPDISAHIEIPDSYFVGTDVIYEFRKLNNLNHLMNQKYLPIDEVRASYPEVVALHLAGSFSPEVVQQFRGVLEAMEDSPIIVRSSSLLEDNFGFAFAGKYDSYFCPNQGSPEQNLADLMDKIKRVYASTSNPDAILYRQQHGLVDYDERMAILIQRVRGKRHGRYFFPTLAGVGFSQNPFRWNRKIRREAGFLRLVAGMGTRAVERVDRDYPRMIALSHPQLRPETTAKAIRQYSQHYIDVIDLEENRLKTLPINQVIGPDFPELRYIASLEKDGYIQNILSTGSVGSQDDLVFTFDYLTKDAKFPRMMRTALMRLEQQYKTPVDVEYAVEIMPAYPYPDFKLHILQCRPLSQRETAPVSLPEAVPESDILFRTFNLIPDGQVYGIRYIILVDPVKYRQVPDPTTRLELGRAVSRLNRALENEQFIIMGPGRWGSANIDLGVRVTYADIHRTKVLIEMAVAQGDDVPELSYGTHFFQDLVEAGIYSLPLHLQDSRSTFDWEFFERSANRLADFSPQDENLSPYLKLIDVAAERGNRRLNIIMDGSQEEALAYFATGDWPLSDTQGSVSHF